MPKVAPGQSWQRAGKILCMSPVILLRHWFHIFFILWVWMCGCTFLNNRVYTVVGFLPNAIKDKASKGANRGKRECHLCANFFIGFLPFVRRINTKYLMVAVSHSGRFSFPLLSGSQVYSSHPGTPQCQSLPLCSELLHARSCLCALSTCCVREPTNTWPVAADGVCPDLLRGLNQIFSSPP